MIINKDIDIGKPRNKLIYTKRIPKDNKVHRL